MIPGRGTVVFLGPSLPASEARARLPGAEIRPPVRLGDLYALVPRRDIHDILILDGVFHGEPPVWPREILAVIEAGKRVTGAASMGALRALELAPFGMLGIGTVVRWYAEGRIAGDDEVALLHADAEMEWRAISVAMVDLRHILDRAVAEDGLRGPVAARIAARLKATGHARRTPPALAAAAEAEGVPPEAAAALAARARSGAESLKAEDARDALDALASPAGPEAVAVTGPSGAPGWPVADPFPARPEARSLRRLPSGTRLGEALAAWAGRAGAEAVTARLAAATRRWFLADRARAAGDWPGPAELAAFARDWTTRTGADPAAWAVAPHELADRLAPAAVEARVDRAGGLPPGPAPAAARALADWAARHGVTPPEGDPQALADWLLARGPGHFGVPDWSPDLALVDHLLAEAVPLEPAP